MLPELSWHGVLSASTPAHLCDGHPIFLTWRLHDGLPCHRAFPRPALNSGEAFAAMDRLLDQARSGTFYLRQPDIADMIVEAIQYNGDILGHIYFKPSQ